MKVCRNINSKKYFVYLKEIDWERIKAITPLNKIKVLERRLFEDEVEKNESDLLNSEYITKAQLNTYKIYQRHMMDDTPDFAAQKHIPLMIRKVESFQNTGKKTMKTIEIDEDVYEFLKAKADPFEETSPNHVIRRLLGLNIKTNRPERLIKKITGPSSGKAPKTDLRKLIKAGYLQEGQQLFMKFQDKPLSKKYDARVTENGLLYNGRTYTMSRLVQLILDEEGLGISSGAYRGPQYWCTSNDISVKQLWDKYLEK